MFFEHSIDLDYNTKISYILLLKIQLLVVRAFINSVSRAYGGRELYETNLR